MWQSYFDKTFIISLPRRNDRQELIVKQFNEYEIYAEIYDAIEHDNGAFGLALTMKKLFTECLEAGYERILIFEDDAEFLERPEMFHQTMCKCVNDLKGINCDIFYLGLQHVKEFDMWRTQNILPVSCGYSTHAAAYSKHAMQFFVDRNVLEPIDNFWVREFQPMNTCFCAYPMLATQRTNYSDIGKEMCNWHQFISASFEKSIRGILQYRTQF